MNSVILEPGPRRAKHHHVLSYSSALCTFLTHEPISTKAAQQTALGSVPASALRWEQDKSFRASACVWPLGQKNIWRPSGNHRQALWGGDGFVRLYKAASKSLQACVAGSVLKAPGHRKSIPHGGP